MNNNNSNNNNNNSSIDDNYTNLNMHFCDVEWKNEPM